MIGGIRRVIVAGAARQIAPRIQTAIVQLAEAHDYSQNVRVDVWQYAVEIDDLKAIGVTASDLRWLVRSGYARHAREVTKPGNAARKFRADRGVRFTKKTCFVATDAAIQLTAIEPVAAGLRRAA